MRATTRRVTLSRRLVAWLVSGVVGLLVATLIGLVWYANAQVDRRRIEAIEDQGTATEVEDEPPADPDAEPVTFLVVGSDDRSGLTEEQQRELSTGGDMGPVRTDVILVAQLRPGDEQASLVSVPRDLLVDHDGRDVKINSILARSGRNGLVRTVEGLLGLQLDHYVEVSIPAFLTVVEAVGGVEVCLDEPLADADAGIDLPAGCQELDAPEALGYVRSRKGERGDFRRIERQQQFLQALLDDVTSARTAIDLPRLFRIADRVAGSLTTDEALGLRELRSLAEELRRLASGTVGAATVPAYAVDEGLELYEPGAELLFQALRDGEELPDTGTPEERAAAAVRIFGDGRDVGRVESVLFFLGFAPEIVASGPVAPDGTEVYATDDEEGPPTWVANILGVEVSRLPPGEDPPQDPDVLVGVGRPAQRAADG